MNEIVRAKSINFSYKIISSSQTSIKSLLTDSIRRKIRIENHTVIKDLSFVVNRGEILAIIGGNGAGKSTLLKLIAKVIPTSSGELITFGKIAPMIQLGAGFNPELSGRENIIFYSALLGRNLNQVKNRVEEIAEWAGITKQLDHQLRTYSTGMVARLAFAVATDETPDILLIDEVLSVGDKDFLQKSRNRIQTIIESGTTIILVSHDLNSVNELADKVLWLKDGEKVLEGKPPEVISAYRSSQS
jgi:ABC-type polysaccharide/polyol phosphate transport system ATPase subunit